MILHKDKNLYGFRTWICRKAHGAMPTGAHAPTVEEYLLRENVTSATGEGPEEVIYRPPEPDEKGFNRAIRSVSVPTITVFRPAKAVNSGIALIVCPGGGYGSLVFDREGLALGRHFQQFGITVLVLKYRLPQPQETETRLPLSQQDALAAIRFARLHAAEWGLNLRRIGILGCSAGGHLAGSAAILGDEQNANRADFVALLYPVVCMAGSYVHEASRLNLLGRAPEAQRLAEYSLEQNIRPGLPPFFMVHARDDSLVPVENSIMLQAALRRANVPHELLLVPSGGHGFALGRNRDSSVWPDRFMRWLDALP